MNKPEEQHPSEEAPREPAAESTTYQKPRLESETIETLNELADAIGRFMNGMELAAQRAGDSLHFWPREEHLAEAGALPMYRKMEDLCAFIQERLALVEKAREGLYDCRAPSSALTPENAIAAVEELFSEAHENPWDRFLTQTREEYEAISTKKESFPADSDVGVALRTTLARLEEFVLTVRNKSTGGIQGRLSLAQSGLSQP